MNHHSKKFGAYRMGDGQQLLSTMTAGIRHFEDKTVVHHRKREMFSKISIMVMQTVLDHRPLVLMLVLLSVVFGYTFLTLSSLAIILLLAFSLRSRKGTL